MKDEWSDGGVGRLIRNRIPDRNPNRPCCACDYEGEVRKPRYALLFFVLCSSFLVLGSWFFVGEGGVAHGAWGMGWSAILVINGGKIRVVFH